MFPPEGLFSSISCPYQGECNLPRCIFNHHRHEPENGRAVPEVEAKSSTPKIDEGGDRKRRKLDTKNEIPEDGNASYDTESVTFEPEKLATVERPLAIESSIPAVPPKKSFASTRDISPPPLKRSSQVATPKLSTSQSQNVTVGVSTPKSKVQTPVKTPVKDELLYPRALKSGGPAKATVRYQLLQHLHKELKRLNDELAKDASDVEEELVLSDQAIISKALDLEVEAAGSPAIYSNLVKNQIMKFKKMKVKDWMDERTKDVAKQKAREAALLSDTPISKPSAPPVVIETGLTVDQEIKLLEKLHTSVGGLTKHGYITTVPTPEEIALAKSGVEAANGWEVCDRCKSRFQVFPDRREDGSLTSGGKCTYHYGKLYLQDKSATDPKAKRERRYKCCGETNGESAGCTQGESHVFKISEVKRMAVVQNFVETPENLDNCSKRPVCIDGEMGYTVYGLELIRLTATSWPDQEELFDVLVKPIGPILDLNSRFSGVWPKDIAEAPVWTAGDLKKGDKIPIVDSPATARALLFSYLSPNTPLIGHGLENDLNATRIIHPTIIDTALLFPHSAGLPYRNGLKALMAKHLNKHVQVVVDGNMTGHDSKEDANAAGELVRFKLAQRWKAMRNEGWCVDGDEFKPTKTRATVEAENATARKRPRAVMEEELQY